MGLIIAYFDVGVSRYAPRIISSNQTQVCKNSSSPLVSSSWSF
jgi:hypothetical protein